MIMYKKVFLYKLYIPLCFIIMLVLPKYDLKRQTRNLNLSLKIVSYLGVLLSISLILGSLGVILNDYVITCTGSSSIQSCIMFNIFMYFIISGLYIFIFEAMHFAGSLSFMKMLHTILICIVFIPFVDSTYHTLSLPMESIFCMAPVALTVDLLCVYLVYKKHCIRFFNNYHVLPKLILYTVAIIDQITQSYILLEIVFLLLFTSDLVFFFKFRNYNFKTEKKLDLMKLEEYQEN